LRLSALKLPGIAIPAILLACYAYITEELQRKQAEKLRNIKELYRKLHCGAALNG
jgi:hypothetical protein